MMNIDLTVKDSSTTDNCLETNENEKCLELNESNQTESSLQSIKLNNIISGTESEPELDINAVESQTEPIESAEHQNLINNEILETSLNTNIEQREESEIEIREEPEEDMKRVRKARNLIEVPMDSTCLPPTYARQPPDGREITLNFADYSFNNNKSNIPPLSTEIIQMQASIHEDSGVFIDNDSPSPVSDYSVNSICKSGSDVAFTRIKYKSNFDNTSDADTGITSMSSDSMDELDSGPLPLLKFNKQITTKSYNPSPVFTEETESNGYLNNATNNQDLNNSIKDRIAMFDIQTNDSFNNDDERRTNKLLKNSSFKSEPSLSQLVDNSETTLNGKADNDLSTISTSIDIQNTNKCNDMVENTSIYNIKSTFMHTKSSSISSNLSDYTNSQQTNAYAGHLQPSYLRYSSLGSNNDNSSLSNSYTGIGFHKPLLNGSLLSSILETRKQNASKLKGLIIPDIPTTSEPAVSKALPTIFSNTCTSSALLTSKPEEVSSLTQKQNILQPQTQSNASFNYQSQRQSLLSEPPWMQSSNPSLPKYSPAFKRRQLELPRSLSLLNTISTDDTDSRNTSVNRSNSTSGLSSNDSQFHFSLSHSKPVIPLMPETAILSPNIDNKSNVQSSCSSVREQSALEMNDNNEHSFIQRRYSADVCNNSMNSIKFSLEKRTSADSIVRNPYQGSNNLFAKNDISLNQSNNNNHETSFRLNSFPNENVVKPIIMERKNNKTNNNDNNNLGERYSWDNSVITSNSKPNSLNGFDLPLKSSFHSDSSDDDSSTISHKTSEDSSIRADDSASDSTADSLDQALSPDFSRPKVLGSQLTVLKDSIETEKSNARNDNNVESVKNFKALAEKWEQRSGPENSSKNIPPPLPPKPSASVNRMPPSLMPRTKKSISNTDISSYNQNKNNEQNYSNFDFDQSDNQIIEQIGVHREFEIQTKSIKSKSDSSSDNSCSPIEKGQNIAITSRSRSVSDICKVFENNGSDNESTLTSVKSNASLTSIETIEENKLHEQNDTEDDIDKDSEENLSIPKERENVLDLEKSNNDSVIQNDGFLSDTDKSLDNIENEDENKSNNKSVDKSNESEDRVLSNHHRMSSIDSIASDSGNSSNGVNLRHKTSSISNLRDSQYGSVSSLASTTSLISPQELQQLIEEANQSLESNDINSHNVQVVVLHREFTSSGNIGITLAGGSDCETKEITVHRVISGSLTDRDNRIRKGDRILSINGKILKGVTHKEALSIMKAPRPEVVIVLSRFNGTNGQDINESHSRQSSSEFNEYNANSLLSSNTNEEHISSKDFESSVDSNYKILKAELNKDVAGLGFILEGGKDSPLGDRPLAIKRIFRGGPADKEGTLAASDEIISVNEHSVHNMTRTEAWNFLKKLPDGPVVLIIKRKKY